MPILSLLLMSWCLSNLHLQNATHSNLKSWSLWPNWWGMLRTKGLWRLWRPCHRDLTIGSPLRLSRWVWTALLVFQRKTRKLEQAGAGREPATAWFLLRGCTLKLAKYYPGRHSKQPRENLTGAWDGIVPTPEIGFGLNSLSLSLLLLLVASGNEGTSPICLVRDSKCRQLRKLLTGLALHPAEKKDPWPPLPPSPAYFLIPVTFFFFFPPSIQANR